MNIAASCAIEISDNKKCNINRKYEDGSCFTLKELRFIASTFNEVNQEKIQFDERTTKNELVKLISKSLHNVCGADQLCWVRFFIRKRIKNNEFMDMLKDSHRPFGPTDNTWLSNINIDDILNDYMVKYSDIFYKLQTVPRDYLVTLPKFSYEYLSNKVKSGIQYFGCVANTDRSGQGGKHWVAFFCDIKNKHVFFFDSTGSKPLYEFLYFCYTLENLCKGVNNNPITQSNYKSFFKNDIIHINSKDHQHDGTECGVYSSMFIIYMLDACIEKNMTSIEAFNKLNTIRLTDTEVAKCRNHLFVNENRTSE